ncbi:hypothetical protein [Halioxenophilus sp. WMMB6]|uniref:hypothetical protein n=1 Tax=Halioxenophilus sp. WMMB6 TaxID=3073815 RepID=UPI00295F1D8B|nr:hypothetical protein [Halioxenophilus sp. WMMB6]
MNVSSAQSNYQLSFNSINSNQNVQFQGSPPPPPQSEETVSLSSAAQALSGLTEDQQTELADYLRSIQQASESGAVDAEALAEEAPEFLQTLASELGIEMSDLVNQLADMSNSPPPPPPPMSPADMEAVRGFHEQVLSSVESGSYDEASLAASAPESVVTMAQARGMEVSELVAWMSENDLPPAPPSGQPPAFANSLVTDDQPSNDMAKILSQFF